MKKYNKPEIVTLALETVDVIETSGEKAAAAVAGEMKVSNVEVVAGDINNMASAKWSW